MTATMWTPRIGREGGPVYLAIADALAADISAGILPDGARLPTQRALAETLGIDFTTVTRAYSEARKRGLIEGRVGQGTFVRSHSRSPALAKVTGRIDMSMNLPPLIDDAVLVDAMWAGLDDLKRDEGVRVLMRYHEPGGTMRDRSAGAEWLRPRLGKIDPRRVLVAPGAQGALTALAGSLAAPGDTILVESLNYPGFLTLAAHMKLRLVPVGSDKDGILPDELERKFKETGAKALYCTPTLHNPTTRSWSQARRLEVLSVVEREGLPVIEDDAYGPLHAKPYAPLAQLAPPLVYHLATLSKCLAPALRIAYLVVPDLQGAVRLSGAMRATTAMASPLTAALAARWIEGGTASGILAAIRDESRTRQILARTILHTDHYQADPEGYHGWLSLPPNWTRADLIARLNTMGVAVVASDAFAVGHAPEAVRLGLGAAASRDELSRSLEAIAALLHNSPAMSNLVV